MDKYLLIANYVAGKGKGKKVASATQEEFKSRGVAFDLHVTRGTMDARSAARNAIGKYRAVVAIGGDGTLNEISQALAHTDMPLGHVPGGSGNDFSKSLNLPRGVRECVDVVLAGNIKTIDLGRANDRYFINAMGIGFDAAVNIETRKFKKLKGLAAYFVAFLKTIARWQPVRMTAEINGESIEQATLFLAVGNGHTCGGGFRLTPHAVLDDGLLDICMVQPMPLPVLAWHLPKVFTGTIERVKYAKTFRTDKLTVTSAFPMPSHLDGEVFSAGAKHYDIEVVSQALRVIGNFN